MNKKRALPLAADNQFMVLQELLKDNEESQWYIDELTNGGPKHKQILSVSLLEAVDKLVSRVADKTGRKFEVQPGIKLSKEYSTGTHPFPIQLPVTAGHEEGEDVATLVQQAPDHELLAYLTAIQALKWATDALK